MPRTGNTGGSSIDPAHKIKLGTVQDGARPVHVSEVTDDVTHDQYILSAPLKDRGGARSKYRVAVLKEPAHRGFTHRRRSFGVKEVYVANAAAHHKVQTERQDILHEDAVMRAAHSDFAFVKALANNDAVLFLMERFDFDLFDAVASSAWTKEDAQALSICVLAQIGKALKKAHKRQVVHDDVKLENIFCKQRSGKMTLADFGAAHDLIHDGPREDTDKTPQYCAPERLRKVENSPPSDVWSVGIVLLQILTRGKHPLALKDPEADDAASKMKRRIESFKRWHHISMSEPGVEDFARRMHLDHGKLGDFILHDILNPDPVKRATAADLVAFAHSQHWILASWRVRKFFKRAGARIAASKSAQETVATLARVARHQVVPTPLVSGESSSGRSTPAE